MGILEKIVETKVAEVARLLPDAVELRAAAEASSPPRDFEGALRRPGEVALIAEIKRRSPSAGWIREELSVAEVASAYAGAGAAALSVLTDAEYFGGSLDNLREARAAVSLPLLRKDFIIDPVQLWEARAAGADAVLLIVRILEDPLLADLGALARELGLGVLVEAHTAAEVERAVGAGATVVGINSRDLDTFHTDLNVALSLASLVPADRVVVAESGIRTSADVDRVGGVGAHAILVGESLMRQPEVARATAALVGRPRVERPRVEARAD
jgi:indole-3-glycerol phosphate synthase